MPQTTALAATTINFRASEEQKALLDRAAACLGKTRTAFILDTTREAAQRVLLDRRVFILNDDDSAAFEAALSAPAKPNDALRRLMNTPPPWRE